MAVGSTVRVDLSGRLSEFREAVLFVVLLRDGREDQRSSARDSETLSVELNTKHSGREHNVNSLCLSLTTNII
jgi:hypothetical protein